MKKLLLGVCTRGADIHYRTYEFMSYTVCNVPNSRMMTVYSPYSASDGQERLFQAFLDSDADYLLVVDADVVPSLDAATRLMAHDKQIVLAPTWFYDDVDNAVFYGVYKKWSDNAKEEAEERQMAPQVDGLERIVSGGFGCMLVRRDVASRFRDAKESFVKWSPLLPVHMKERASDNIFWAKCTLLGIEAYVDWSIETIHYRTVGLSNSLINKVRNAREVVCCRQ